MSADRMLIGGGISPLALDQVAAFTSASGHAPEVWVRAVNATLPPDIAVREGRGVGPEFNPVAAAGRKRYR